MDNEALVKEMKEMETIKITVEREGKTPEVLETKSLLLIMMDPEKMVLAEMGWNVSPDLLAMHLANMEQVKMKEGESATHDAMKRMPTWRGVAKKVNRKKNGMAKKLRELFTKP